MKLYLAIAVLTAGWVGFSQVEHRVILPALANPKSLWSNAFKLLCIATLAGVFWPLVLLVETWSYLSKAAKEVLRK